MKESLMPAWNKEIPGRWKVINLDRGSGEGPYQAIVTGPEGKHSYVLTADYYGKPGRNGKRKYNWVITQVGRDKPVTVLSKISQARDYLLGRDRVDDTGSASSPSSQQTPPSIVLEQAAAPLTTSSEFSAEEGDRIIREVEEIERCRKLTAEAKKDNRNRNGGNQIVCEACGLSDPESGMFDAHHKEPLAIRVAGRETHLTDLAVLCPTCHRWAHVKSNDRFAPLPVEQIRLARLVASAGGRAV